MLTAKQKELHDFIADRVRATGVSPSFEEMKEALGLRSKSGVHRLVAALEQRGFVRRLAYRARAIELMREPGDNVIDMARARAEREARYDGAVVVPLHGRIAAGLPVEAMEDDASLTVPAALLGPGDHYALQVSGDSMVDAGIFDGDFALIRTADIANDGDIIVALIDNHEATLKYYRREKGQIRLDPANAAHQPQLYLPSRVRIQGRLAGLLRRY